ncbi:MAG: dienelactone hydrolase family protein [Clostridia bacterium]|nr:dienelactone hydrolase family protein [Clostridia bacterium]
MKDKNYKLKDKSNISDVEENEKFSFLTCKTLWNDFDDTLPLQSSKTGEMHYENVTYEEYYFSGRKTASGRVRIYGLYVTPTGGESKSALLYIPEITEKMSYEAINKYAKLGYSVLAVDLYGKREGAENFTVYPNDVNFANYESRGNSMDKIEKSARETSWYEWVAVCKYSLKFLRETNGIEKVGVMGIKTGANIAWQLAATEDDLACAVMLFGGGWTAYKGIPYFSHKELIMDEERWHYLSAIDAHAYAPYVRCPVLYLTSTNSEVADFDRVNITLSRVNKEVERVFNFAPAFNVYLDNFCKKDVELFFKKYFDGKEVQFAAAPELEISQDDNYLTLSVKFFEPTRVSECRVFINEGVIEPELRNWEVCDPFYDDEESGQLTVSESFGSEATRKFSHVLNGEAKEVFAFAVVRYRNGGALSSYLTYKKLAPSNSAPKSSNLVYTSKDKLEGLAFYDKNIEDKKDVFVDENELITLVEGPNGIYGAYSRYGLISYKLNEPGCKVHESSLVNMDVYASEFCVMRLILMCKTDDGVTEYYYYSEVKASKIWKGITASLSEFKTADGKAVKDYESVFALRIESDGKFAVNNILLL